MFRNSPLPFLPSTHNSYLLISSFSPTHTPPPPDHLILPHSLILTSHTPPTLCSPQHPLFFNSDNKTDIKHGRFIPTSPLSLPPHLLLLLFAFSLIPFTPCSISPFFPVPHLRPSPLPITFLLPHPFPSPLLYPFPPIYPFFSSPPSFSLPSLPPIPSLDTIKS